MPLADLKGGQRPGPGKRLLLRSNRMVPSLSGGGLMQDVDVVGGFQVVVPEWVYCVAQATHPLHLSEGERAALLRGLLEDEDLRVEAVAAWLLARDGPREHVDQGLAVREVLTAAGLVRRGSEDPRTD